jgi:DNA-binding NtrC family response regulator
MLLNVFEKIDEFIAGQAISETKQPKKRDTGAAVDDENLQFSPEAVSPSTSEEVEWESIDEIEKKIKKLAPLELSVLLLGETGTGKEYYE